MSAMISDSSIIQDNRGLITLESDAAVKSAIFLEQKTRFQNKSSPPFRLGGRGSKQVAKALETPENIECVLSISTPVCFAKVVSQGSQDTKKTMIQPFRTNPSDRSLLLPWDGHIWLANSKSLVPVIVR